jgi:hypothetical protein
VERHVTAALHLEQLHALIPQEFRRRYEVLFLRRPAEGDDGRMLEEEQDVLRNCARDSVTRDASLELERIVIRHSSQRDSP